MPDLKGKVAIVTGATSGLGLETATYLASHGAEVILGVRNVEAGKKVAADIKSRFPGSKVEVGPPLDLMSQQSVRAFAEAINKRPGQLNILVNNAGLGYLKSGTTEEGVGLLTQVNHLGPYTLTRMLESKLVGSRARIVNVTSVTHRRVVIKDARQFMTVFRAGYYEHVKLANIYFAYELQRRLGAHGVQACAADPGAAMTNIYSHSPKLSKGLISWMIQNMYAPPRDGAKSIIHAATADWETDRPKKEGTPLLPQNDLRYYARGVFAWPLITSSWSLGGGSSMRSGLGKLKAQIWDLNTVALSLLDWPLRRMFGGRIMDKTVLAKSSPVTYDEKTAAELWDVSAEFAKLPKNPQLS